MQNGSTTPSGSDSERDEAGAGGLPSAAQGASGGSLFGRAGEIAEPPRKTIWRKVESIGSELDGLTLEEAAAYLAKRAKDFPPDARLDLDEAGDIHIGEPRAESDEEFRRRMAAQQVCLARQALGLPNRRGRTTSNRFLSIRGCEAHQWQWERMVTLGRADRIGPGTSGVWYRLTHLGATEALRPGETLDPKTFPPVAAPLDPAA